MRPGTPLARLLSRRGFCSRSQARVLIRSGKVQVGGRICLDPMRSVSEGAEIRIEGKPLPRRASTRRLYALHKPPGYVTTTKDPEGRPTVFDLLPSGLPRLLAIGRLDLESRGLLLLTDDPGLARRLSDPRSGTEKVYRVRLSRDPGDEALSRLAAGVLLNDGYRTRPCRVRRLGGEEIEVTLTEGHNRQIRRMARVVGVRVLDLLRVRVGSWSLGDLAPGALRPLSP